MMVQTALIRASKQGCTNIIVQLLKDDRVDVNLYDNEGDTALIWASHCGYTDTVVELLKHDDVDVKIFKIRKVAQPQYALAGVATQALLLNC
jgi:ankyrin repeat protein